MTHEERAELTAAAYRGRLDWRDPEARLIWADLAIACGVGVTSHAPGDPTSTAHAEGKRAVFLYLAGRVGLPLIPEP
jgi:hypothetical protein